MEINLLHPQAFEKREQLNWSIFSKKLSEFSFFTETENSFNSPYVYNGKGELLEHHERVSQITRFILENKGSIFESTQLKELNSQHIDRLIRGACLDLKEVNYIATLVENFQELISSGLIDSIHSDKFELPNQYKELLKLLKHIRKYVSKRGELIPDNDPSLMICLNTIKDLEYKARQEIQRILSKPEWTEKIQHDGFDLINDHYVVTVKTDHYQSSMGDIISHSQTGASLYIEPSSVKNISTKLLIQKRELQKIIQRLTLSLSQKLISHSVTISNLYTTLLKVDYLQAISHFNLYYDLKAPIVSDGHIELINFYHPLLDNPVRNNLIISQSEQGALISGPNTGGKTVCLKVLAISQLFLHYGFFIPADSSTLPLSQSLFYLGHDDQNVEEGLSAFSAEIQNYIKLLNDHITPAFIVIDEIFNSTSSEEASALTLGFLDQFMKNRSNKIFLSSHHSALKNHIFQSTQLQSMHMGFKKPENIPTYKLIQGSPGSSMAIEVFDQLSKDFPFAQEIKNSAQLSLAKLHSEYEQLISELSSQKSNVQDLQAKLVDTKNKFENEKKSFKNAILLEKEKDIDHIKQQLKSLQAKVGKVEKNNTYSPKKLQQEIRNLDTSLNQSHDLREQEIQRFAPESLLENNVYFSQSLNQNVTLLKNLGQKVQASLGKIKLYLPKQDLFVAKDTTPPLLTNNNVFISVDTHTDYHTDYDCRGMRLSEFEHQLETALQGLLLKKVPYLRIIHGHGDGVLKSYIRSYLKKHDNYLFESCKDSADGATIIKGLS